MSNVLPRAKQVAVISAIVEGVSVRSIERMTGVHRDTIVRLMVKVGQACEKLLDRVMVDLPCTEIEVDEIWGYVAKKQKQVTKDDNASEVGDCWTFVALDPESKLIPCFRTGKRNAVNTRLFVEDLARRLKNRVQLTSDAFPLYAEAIDRAFDCQVDYSHVVKSYESQGAGSGRYSPPRVSEVEKTAIIGPPSFVPRPSSPVPRPQSL